MLTLQEAAIATTCQHGNSCACLWLGSFEGTTSFSPPHPACLGMQSQPFRRRAQLNNHQPLDHYGIPSKLRSIFYDPEVCVHNQISIVRYAGTRLAFRHSKKRFRQTGCMMREFSSGCHSKVQTGMLTRSKPHKCTTARISIN